jgi:hypothetical protein
MYVERDELSAVGDYLMMLLKLQTLKGKVRPRTGHEGPEGE